MRTVKNHPRIDNTAHVQGHLKFATEHLNDAEQDCLKVLWSDESNVELSDINSPCLKLPMTQSTPSQLSDMAVETFCFGDRTTAPKGRWTENFLLTDRALKMGGHGWVFQQ